MSGIQTDASQAMLAGPAASRASSVVGDRPAIVSDVQESAGLGWRSGMDAAILSMVMR